MKEELIKGIERISAALAVNIDSTDGNSMANELAHRVGLLCYNNRLIYLAKMIHNKAKGEVSAKILANDKLLNAKDSVQRLFIAGELAEADALYESCDNAIKSLEKSIEGVRSLLGYEKEIMKKSI